MQGEIHQWDTVQFEAEFRNQTGGIEDISSATLILFLFGKPGNNPPVSGLGSFLTDGRDGLAKYLSSTSDLDKVGDWHLQAFAVLPGGQQFHSDQTKFHVYANIL